MKSIEYQVAFASSWSRSLCCACSGATANTPARTAATQSLRRMRLDFTLNERLQCRRDETMNGRRDADFVANPCKRGVQPWQLEPASVFEILEHRRLRLGRHAADVLEHVRERARRESDPF